VFKVTRAAQQETLRHKERSMEVGRRADGLVLRLVEKLLFDSNNLDAVECLTVSEDVF
jgi:hypothetical protein